ncbi:DUF309 domain-containing protein [Meiothermus sp. QL-1]|uniref:DUF309 domain-containing protein n=1 Tax=Meiothermus sp. QL-1 TaxID=2058095 RepID=UPI000E0C5AB4|nr:DUF309 domain-containing protein [Meiothermus sp. QL-1]RDI95613.1 DUF309 domain-containing protein [Meiothermus sp. QL-1]
MRLADTPEVQAALALWRKGQFWEVHEVLEPLWQRLAGPGRELVQGLILLAAALHKAKTNPRGGWRNFSKALARLEGLPAEYEGIPVAALVEEARRALENP